MAQSLGYVRETNYGRLFDVAVVADPANLAYSARAIGPHTDNPYRDPVPTVQLLHCLASAAEGGDSALVDGFMAASVLREANPAAFATLTSTPVTFGYRDATADLRATLPMIGLSARGRIRQVRYNNRSLQPLRPQAGQAPEAFAAKADAFYQAYLAFAEILARPDLTLAFRLDPGDCLIFDNTRIMHARTAFTGAGNRHLQGCYADPGRRSVRPSRAEQERPGGAPMTTTDPVQLIAGLFASEGAGEYLGEAVTQAAHMLQTAALAEQDDAADSLIAASPAPRRRPFHRHRDRPATHARHRQPPQRRSV